MDQPHGITVILPTYNSGSHLQRAIESVLGQSYQHWTLLVIDDASSDGSVTTAHAMAAQDQRIQILSTPRNLGVAQARNLGLMHVQSEYVAFLDADDAWLPNKLTTQLSFMLKRQSNFCCTAYRIVGPDDAVLGEFIPRLKSDYEWLLTRHNDPLPSATMYRYESFPAFRFPDLKNCEDLAMWLAMLREGGTVDGLQEVLTLYRRHPNSLSRKRMLAYWNRLRLFLLIEKLGPVRSIKLLLARKFGSAARTVRNRQSDHER